jgi:hypothetical protein
MVVLKVLKTGSPKSCGMLFYAFIINSNSTFRILFYSNDLEPCRKCMIVFIAIIPVPERIDF